MADYDGTEFVGLDSDCVAADTPVDSWLLNRSRGNTLYRNSKEACTAVFYVGSADALNTNTGHRPYMAVNEYQTVMLFDLPVDSSWSGIEVTGCYNAQSSGSDQNAVDARFSLDGAGEHYFTIANTDNAGSPSFETFSETWTFQDADEDIISEEAQMRRFTLWIRSQPGDTTAWDTLSNVDNVGYAHVTNANGDIANVTTSAPTANSIETKYVRYQDGNVSEVISVDPRGTSSEIIYTWPRPGDIGLTQDLTVSFYDGVFIQFRSITIRPIYKDEALTDLKQSEMLPQQTFDGVDAVEHVYALRRLRARPRLISFGPTGYNEEVDEEWPATYAQMWPYQQGDSSGQTYLIDDAVFIDGENPIITVSMYVIQTMFAPSFASAVSSRNILPSGEATWDFDLTVVQLDNGDTAWSSATSLLSVSNDDVPIDMFPANYREGRYQLVQSLLHDYSDWSTASPENYGWAYREGTLVQSDIPLVRRITLIGKLSSFTTRQVNPTRIRVSAALNTVNQIPWSEQVSAGDINPRIRLALVGYSIHASHDIDPDG